MLEAKLPKELVRSISGRDSHPPRLSHAKDGPLPSVERYLLDLNRRGFPAAAPSTHGRHVSQTVVIAGSHNSAKIRNPWGVLGLNLITFGIYHLFWWYYANRELKDYGIVKQRDLGDSPTRSLLAIWFGAYTLFIATVWTIVGTSKRIKRAQAIAGVEDRCPRCLAALDLHARARGDGLLPDATEQGLGSAGSDHCSAAGSDRHPAAGRQPGSRSPQAAVGSQRDGQRGTMNPGVCIPQFLADIWEWQAPAPHSQP